MGWIMDNKEGSLDSTVYATPQQCQDDSHTARTTKAGRPECLWTD
jgi:hypothetical protein